MAVSAFEKHIDILFIEKTVIFSLVMMSSHFRDENIVDKLR